MILLLSACGIAGKQTLPYRCVQRNTGFPVVAGIVVGLEKTIFPPVFIIRSVIIIR